MGFIDVGPLDMNELPEMQRSCTELFMRHGWKPLMLGYLTGGLTMQHTEGDVCIIHRDGRVEPLEDD